MADFVKPQPVDVEAEPLAKRQQQNENDEK
jgi:hypothetical protein